MLTPRTLLFATAVFSGMLTGWTQSTPDYENPPIAYSASTPVDAVTRLQTQIGLGALQFEGSEQRVLQTVLDALHVPVESQLLVFSKTSLQRGLIRPERPRALYFSDSVYVGWVPGGLIEVIAIDPRLGPVFYSVETRQAKTAAPTVVREPDCLRCHGGTFVRDIPGVFSRSVFASASGEPLLRHGTVLVDDETPFAERWGGWYVTGYHGSEPHRGNTLYAETDDRLVFTPVEQRPDDLRAFFDVERYLAPISDVVALLVFEHQTTMQNALTRAGLATRKMLAYQRSLQEAFKETITDEPTYDSVKSVFASSAQEVVDRLLFRDAAPLPQGVDGNEAFRRHFSALSKRSPTGVSLRDFQLQDRLFALRCSYLIYSESFSALPEQLKVLVFAKLAAALHGKEGAARYGYLEAEERRRIYDVLFETHPDAAKYWVANSR